MSLRLIVTAFCASMALAACTTMESGTALPQAGRFPSSTPAPAVTQGIERYVEQRSHVESVAYRLRRTAEPECSRAGKSKVDLGIIVWSLANFPNAEDRAHLQSAFALSARVTVAIAAESGPAARAGLSRGDVIAEVNGKQALEGAGATEHFIATSNQAARQGAVSLKLASGRTLDIAPEKVCGFAALLVRSTVANAAADGRSIAITTGLFELMRSDDELALVLAHELAHNILGHLSSPAKRSVADDGAAVEAMASPPALQADAPYSPAMEIEADRAGLFFMARAGFDISAAEAMWTRLNRTTNASALSRTHPAGPERLSSLKHTVTEIRTKQKSGAPLDPGITPHR